MVVAKEKPREGGVTDFVPSQQELKLYTEANVIRNDPFRASQIVRNVEVMCDITCIIFFSGLWQFEASYLYGCW